MILRQFAKKGCRHVPFKYIVFLFIMLHPYHLSGANLIKDLASSGSEFSKISDVPEGDTESTSKLDEEIEVDEDKEDDDYSSTPKRRYYALDPQNAVRLALAEQKIYTKLLVISSFDTRNNISKEVSVCYQSLTNYLKDYEHDTNSLGGTSGYPRAKLISENPLLLFRMIRRIVGTLDMDMVKATCSRKSEEHLEIVEAIKTTLNASELDMPVENDLNDALFGLLRIQFVYGLNATKDLRIGILQGLHTNATLTVEDCVVLGLWALQKLAINIAYQWFAAAELNLAENLTTEDRKEAKQKIESSWKNLVRYTGLQTLEQVHLKIRGQRQTHLPAVGWWHYQYYATCRGEGYMAEDVRKDLKCYSYVSLEDIHPYWLIQSLKMEMLHNDPPIWLFHDFVGNKTMEYIKKKTQMSYVRSEVVESKDDGGGSLYRTSMQDWIFDDDLSLPDQEMVSLVKRQEVLLDVEIFERGSSQALQVVQYSSLGGHYDFHGDSLANTVHVESDGDRIFTFFMFLNDVELGGYTAFPEMNIFVKPKRGNAVLWPNLFRNGTPDERTNHAGCPVVKGVKLGANKWIMQNRNIFRYKCTLDPKE